MPKQQTHWVPAWFRCLTEEQIGTIQHRIIDLKELYEHFDGECMDQDDLLRILSDRAAYAMTELPLPTAAVYLVHALERYGEEAQHRVGFGG